MALIRDLYVIEAEVRGSDHPTRLAVRQERSTQILTRIDDWMVHHRALASAKSPLGETLAYIAKHHEGFSRFLIDGRFDIDNNTVERTIRPIALNRKNAFFAGYNPGAENCAVIASLTETCTMNGVDPYGWLTATLSAIVQGAQTEPDRRPAAMKLRRHGVIGTTLTLQLILARNKIARRSHVLGHSPGSLRGYDLSSCPGDPIVDRPQASDGLSHRGVQSFLIPFLIRARHHRFDRRVDDEMRRHPAHRRGS